MTTLLREPFASLAAWSNVSFQFTIIPAGRIGTGAQALAGAMANYVIPTDLQSEWLTIGFAVRVQPDFVGGHILAYLATRDASTYYQLSLHVSPTGQLQVHDTNGGAIRATTPAGAVPADTWCYVEAQILLHPSAGAIALRVDDVLLADVTGVNTRSSPSGGPGFGRIDLYGGQYTGQVHFFDDLYIKGGAGETFLGDTYLGPEARSSRSSLRVGFPEPGTKDWYRLARQSARVGFSEPPVPDRQRLARLSTRVAFQGADVAGLVGGIHARVLSRPTGGNALLGYVNARVLSRPLTGGNALASAVRLQVLHPFVAPEARFWDGTDYVSGPVSVWNGVTFASALGVRLWNGSAWVDAV